MKIFLSIFLFTIINLPLFAQFNYPDFSSVAGLNLIEDAAQMGDTLRISPSDLWKRGAVWAKNKQNIQNGFSNIFEFQITDLILGGADGFAFVIQNNSDSTIGGLGGSIGYDSISNSIAVEFDSYFNSSFNDPNSNHISVQTAGVNPNSSHHSYSIGHSTNIPDLSDGNVHKVKIEYTPDTLKVFIDDLTNSVLDININIDNTLNLDNGSAWVGFTAGSGDRSENHDLVSWSYSCEIPTSIPHAEEYNTLDNYKLYQNYPNPFNPKTNIEYYLPKSGNVFLKVYNILGQEIITLVNEAQSPGNKFISWNGKDKYGNRITSGFYIYQLQISNTIISRKMLYLK